MRLKYIAGIAIKILFVFFVVGQSLAIAQTGRAWRSDEEERTIQTYKSTNGAVVFITTMTLTVDPFDVFLEVKPREGSGSGFIVDPKR